MTDQITPNLITVDAQGRVGANFTGRVHALGLDIDAGTSLTPPTESRIRWIKTSDGVVAADLYGLSAFGLDGQVYLRAYSNGDAAFAALEAQDYNLDPAGLGARLFVQSYPAGAVPKRSIVANVEGENFGDPLTPTLAETILDSRGGTAFVRKVFDTRLTSPALTFTVPWPVWATRLQLVVQGIAETTDAGGYRELAMQLNTYGGANYYEILQSPRGGTSIHNDPGWAVLGYLNAGPPAGPIDVAIPALVVAELHKPTVNGLLQSTLWHSRDVYWLPGVGLDEHYIVGMLYGAAAVDPPTTVTLSLVNSARGAGGGNFATNTRVKAYAYP